MKKILGAMAIFFLAGCAMGPALYPNAHLQQVGEAQSQKDIADCEALADAYVKSNAGVKTAQDTAIGGIGGAVIGGAAGAVTGDFTRGLGIGAASGAAAGLVHGIIKASQPSPLFMNFVNKCLQEKGYQVIGWQ